MKIKMTMFYPLIIGLLILSSNAHALPQMKTTFHVVDAETSQPVTNAIVHKSFVLQQDWEGTRTTKEEFLVDTNGYCTFSGETMRIAGGGASVVADGYYSDGAGMPFTRKNILLNRWEPWNPQIEVRMRKIKKPIPMVHFFHGGNWIRLPQPDHPIGFDLELSDWVAPYGKGSSADLLFNAYEYENEEGICSGYTLTFSNPADGIQVFVPKPEASTSEFIFPYLAPENGYETSLTKYKKNPHYAAIEQNYEDNKNVNYIFRVRTKTDTDGHIMSACYGRIQGELTMSGKLGLQYEYWFNPVPNERSLEWNGENLLKK